MQILSASEAIGPAWERTKSIFFQPFKWGRSWKLAAVAYLAQMGAFFLPTPMHMMFGARHAGMPGAKLAILLGALGLVLSAIVFLLFYIGSRMQFVLFESVATRSSAIAPLWSKYREQVWRWIGLKLLLTLVAGAVLWSVVLGPFRRLMEHMPTTGHPPGPGFVAALFAFVGALFIGSFALMMIAGMLTDFVLPFLALENAPISHALRRFRDVVEADPGEFILFVLVKILLAVAFTIGGYVALFLAEIATMIPCAIIGGILWLLLRSFGVAGQVLLLVALVVGGFLMFVWLFYLITLGMGFILTFFEALALYFLAGRYPLLGNLMEPPAPAPVAFENVPAPPPLPPTPAADGVW